MFFISSMIASVLNYLLYPLLSRMLSPGEMGDVGMVYTVVIQTGTVLLALNLVSIYLLTNHKEEFAHGLIEKIQNTTLKLSVLACGLSVLLFPLLKTTLKLDSYMSLVGMTCLLIVVVPAITWTGYIQGRKALGMLGVYNVLNAITKTGGAVILAYLGFGAEGAIFGFLLGFIVSLFILWRLSPFQLPNLTNTKLFQKNEKYLEPKVKRYVLSSFALAIILAAFYSLDIVFAKLSLSKNLAGIYIGLSTLAGAVYFLIMTVAWIITPNYSKTNDKHNLRLLLKTITGAILLTAVATLFFWLQGERVVNLALGSLYAPYSHILWKITISQGLIAIVSMLAYYIKVRGKSGSVYVALTPFAFALFSVLFFAENDMGAMINRILQGEVIGIMVCAFVFALVKIKSCIK